MSGALQAVFQNQRSFTSVPGAPTIGTATDATGGAVSVTFSAPACTGSNAITGYIATSTPGSVTGTAASSPVVVSGLTNGTAYTFKVKATNGVGTGPESAASNSATPTAVVGQQAYTTAGTFSWTAPAGVTSVSVVAVGGGGTLGRWPSSCSYANGGGGGALAYANNISVTPGSSYTVVVGAAGCCSNGGCSSFNSTSVKAGGGKQNITSCTGGAGGTVIAGTGGAGGAGGRDLGRANASPGGGGAGGYSGTGGLGANAFSLSGGAGAGGGGGGGVGYRSCGTCAGGGGGVGILGQGASGAGGSSLGKQGCGGSGGCGGATATVGAIYGGGGGRYTGAKGAVRIIWPGTTRSFPSTCTGNL